MIRVLSVSRHVHSEDRPAQGSANAHKDGAVIHRLLGPHKSPTLPISRRPRSRWNPQSRGKRYTSFRGTCSFCIRDELSGDSHARKRLRYRVALG